MHVNLVSKLVSYRCKVLALAEGYRKSLNRRPAVSLNYYKLSLPPYDIKGRENLLLPNVSRTPGHDGSLSSQQVRDTAHLRLGIVQGVCAPLAHSKRCRESLAGVCTRIDQIARDLLHFLLRPFEVSLDVFGRFHALCEVRPCLG